MKPPSDSALVCVGEALRAWRKSSGLTQEDAAKRIGITKSGWCRYERGEVQLGLLDALRAQVDMAWVCKEAERQAARMGVEFPGSPKKLRPTTFDG
jgi:transcriptional regulator with XRE-family HTH domain